MWLAKVGYERIEETEDPELVFDRAMEKPKTFIASKKVARKGGGVAGNARKDLEKKLGNSVISPLNAKDLGRKDNELTEGDKE
jgi:hypothetical protein